MKRSVIHLGEDLEYTRSSAALSEHNRSGPKSRRARCSLAVTARSGVNGGGCVVAREAWKKEGRRHGSKRMVTCDRHCEATERPLSMPARLCAFLLPRKRPLSLSISLSSPALTTASADVSVSVSRGQRLKTDSHPLKPLWNDLARERAPSAYKRGYFRAASKCAPRPTTL